MSLLDTIMFWRKNDRRKEDHEPVIEHVEGYEVDGCFTLPDARLDDIAPVEPNTDDC